MRNLPPFLPQENDFSCAVACLRMVIASFGMLRSEDDLRALAVAFLLALVAPFSHAEQLPVRVWTTADGLPHNHINRIKRDSHGYLWICTDEGLARFDGYRFSNYGTAQGLPNLTVNDFLATRDGAYWVATDGGVCLFNPLGKAAPYQPNAHQPMFTVYRISEQDAANRVNGLLEDKDGSLWLATSGGLFHLRRAGERINIEPVEIGLPQSEPHVVKLFFDSRGALWITAISGLYRLWPGWPNGRAERYGAQNGLPSEFVQSFFEDRRGRLWVGSRHDGLFLLTAEPQPGQKIVEKVYRIEHGLPSRDIRSITPLPDGRVWICSVGGLTLFDPAASDDRKFTNYTPAHGLITDEIYNLVEDNEGNLWLGTRNSGVMRIAGAGFTTFGPSDGFTPGAFNTILESRSGELLIYNGARYWQRSMQRFDGRQFIGLPHQGINDFGAEAQQSILQDRFGEWWAATGRGLYRYPKMNRLEDFARALPKMIYNTRQGLTRDYVARVYEDRRGDLWLANDFGNQGALFRWERVTDTIQPVRIIGETELPTRVNTFGEDAEGNLWIALDLDYGLVRYRDGQVTKYTAVAGKPAGRINHLFLDSQKRLWLATSNSGLHRLDEVAADRLRLTSWDVTKGLATNEVWSITEDQWGRIYAGTGRGVDRLDPATGHIRHFTFADGLAKGEVRVSLRDRHNQLWFVTEQGVSRLLPKLEEATAAPPVFITALRVNGNPAPLSELGATKLENLTFAPGQNSVQIDFVSLDFSAGARLRYQYQLNAQDWSAPSDERTISFANLAPGAYRFAVRALNSSGVISEPPALVRFTIQPPLWRRWWFLSLLAAALAGLAYGAYRYRIAQLIALERMRTSIAADLHDDIGANLTRISILSEIAKQQNGATATSHTLTSIAEIARESVAAMSDIVWAINPERDNLRDLTRRMRELAEEVCTTRGIRLQFNAPEFSAEFKLDSHTRHDLYLIFKEALNNAARHSDCTRATIDVRLVGAQLHLTISDNGRGFDPTAASEGNGLHSLDNRAKALGGQLEIESGAGGGTRVHLNVLLTGV